MEAPRKYDLFVCSDETDGIRASVCSYMKSGIRFLGVKYLT